MLKSFLVLNMMALGGCATATATDAKIAAPESVALAPETLKSAEFEEAMAEADERQRVFSDPAESLALTGDLVQGGLVFATTLPGARVSLDGEPVMVSDEGRFILGFGRDHGKSALLVVTHADSSVVRRALDIADREFPVDRIDGLDQSKVSGFTEAQLKKIGEDNAKKDAARKVSDPAPFWAGGFSWPVTGRISGVFGSQRILNGEAKRPHSGVDVAAPAGAPVKAPADGIVRLAESNMYFEGGLVFIDHGQRLESAFLHLSRIDVKAGERVKAGQVIGAVGATGRATGPHMHWSLKWMGTLVDPALVAGDMRQADNSGR
ncbi:MAG: M23 family metallopeptidase [Parvularculaceae bacterium]|nr:M23 family metallopeptidase [Parvularculaceae bacterium]